MPKASPIQTSFEAGELSPLVQGRVDVEKYKKALATCLNYIPTLQGPLVRRPGTKYIVDVKDPSNPPALIPFRFSATQNYMLEFGANYIRFFANEGQVITTSNIFRTSGGLSLSNFQTFAPGYLTNVHFDGVQTVQFSRPGQTVTGSSVIPAGSVLEMATPFTQPEVQNLKYAQSGDTLYIVGSSHAVYKLQRYGQYDWNLQPVLFQDGPYLPFNSYQTNADSLRWNITPSTIGGKAAIPPTLSVGPSYQVWAAGNNGQGEYRVMVNTSHIFASGDRVCVQAAVVTGGTPLNNGTSHVGAEYWVVDYVSANQLDLKGSIYSSSVVLVGSTGLVAPALFQLIQGSSGPVWADSVAEQLRPVALLQGGIRFWGYITSVFNAASAGASFQVALSSATETDSWQMGVWGRINGYPTAACFHQDRLVLTGAANRPQELIGSMTSDYEHFATAGSSLQVADNNAYQFNLLSSESNPLRWLKSSAQGLLSGSNSTEWQVSPNNQATALTPTNVNAQATSFFGSANVDAVQAGNATIYVQSAYRKVRELNYFFQVGTFRSTDLAELSEHLTAPRVTKLAVQKEPYPLIWALRSDGWMLSMSYNRDDTTIKAGWARHSLGGQSDTGGSVPIVQSMGVITASSATFDQLWMVTKRFINGTSAMGIETMVPPYNDSMPQEDGYCLDYGATFDNPKAITAIANNGPCVVTAPGHGINNGSSVILTDIIGLNLQVVDINNNVSTVNLVNKNTFLVASTAANSFYLTDFNGNVINASSYSPYVSGGRARALVSHISGLTWLKNETVGIVADGGIHPDVVVDSSGLIALQYPAAKVQIGYRYNSDGMTLRSDVGAAAGSSIGMTRRMSRVAFALHQVGDFSFGSSFSNMLPIEFPLADQQLADRAVPLYSGIIRDGIEDVYDFDDGLSFRQNSGLPGMIQSITSMMEEFDA